MSIAQDRLARAMIVRRGPSRLVYLKTAAPGAVSPRNLPLIVRWSFLLFIASIAFDVDIAGFSSAKLSGFLFFAIYFFYHNPLSRKRSFPPIPPVMSWFVIYVAVYALNGLFLPTEYLSEFFTRLFTLVQVDYLPLDRFRHPERRENGQKGLTRLFHCFGDPSPWTCIFPSRL